MNTFYEKKAEVKKELKKAEARLEQAKAEWKKAIKEKINLRSAYEAVIEASDDVALLDYKRWRLEKG